MSARRHPKCPLLDRPRFSLKTHFPPADEFQQDQAFSATSSLEFFHEPFDSFQMRVYSFAARILWPGANGSEIVVERMKGGSFNRIVGVSHKDEEWILRVPRDPRDSSIPNEVAILEFLRRHTGLPIPRVVLFDDMPDRVLKKPYAIHRRISGVSLFPHYPGLSHENKCRIATEVGDFVRTMLSITSTTAGTVVQPPGYEAWPDLPMHIQPFRSNDSMPYSDEGLVADPVLWFAQIFQADPLECQLAEIAEEIGRDGWFDDAGFCLAHRDLFPRNILIRDPSQGIDDSDPLISAIIDWDKAVFAPKFVACTPPWWIWDWDKSTGHEGEEWKEGDDGLSPDRRELKAVFDEAAGDEFVRYAYSGAYREARILAYIAMEGNGNELWQNFPEIVRKLWGQWRMCQRKHREANASRSAADIHVEGIPQNVGPLAEMSFFDKVQESFERCLGSRKNRR